MHVTVCWMGGGGGESDGEKRGGRVRGGEYSKRGGGVGWSWSRAIKSIYVPEWPEQGD